MKSHDARDPATQRPCAVDAAAPHGEATPSREDSLLSAIGQSPRMLAQRRAITAVFAGAFQRQAASTNHTGLPDGLKTGLESLSGLDMSGVRVHGNSDKPAQLNALAFAMGTDIHLAPGQEQHLPHEAWHVVQQAQGRVQPTRQAQGGTQVNDDPALEHEADAMGAKAAQMKSAAVAQRADETAPTGLVVEDDETAAGHQVRKSVFLAVLRIEVSQVADKVLSAIGQSSADCPYISYWFTYCESRGAAHLLKAIGRYAPAAQGAGSWQELVGIVAGAVGKAFARHLATGSLEGVPDELPKDLIDGREPPEQKEVRQLSRDIAQFCGDCLSSNNTHAPANNLPAWGAAVPVGFHATPHWAAIQHSGQFLPGGGKLGPGIYVGTGLARMYATLGDTTLLEVGYIGDQTTWQRHALPTVGAYDAGMEGLYDAVEVGGVLAQTCFKANGPNAIDFNNFRVRLAQ